MVFKRRSCEGETVFRLERTQQLEPFRVVVFDLLRLINDYRFEKFVLYKRKIVDNDRIRRDYELFWIILQIIFALRLPNAADCLTSSF